MGLFKRNRFIARIDPHSEDGRLFWRVWDTENHRWAVNSHMSSDVARTVARQMNKHGRTS